MGVPARPSRVVRARRGLGDPREDSVHGPSIGAPTPCVVACSGGRRRRGGLGGRGVDHGRARGERGLHPGQPVDRRRTECGRRLAASRADWWPARADPADRGSEPGRGVQPPDLCLHRSAGRIGSAASRAGRLARTRVGPDLLPGVVDHDLAALSRRPDRFPAQSDRHGGGGRRGRRRGPRTRDPLRSAGGRLVRLPDPLARAGPVGRSGRRAAGADQRCPGVRPVRLRDLVRGAVRPGPRDDPAAVQAAASSWWA